MLNPATPSKNSAATPAAGTAETRLVDLKEVNESHLYHQDRDVIWVCVIHGKKTSLALCAIEWVGSLISLSLVADAGVPEGSATMFIAELLLFVSCWLFLLPAFAKVTQALKRLVLFISLWAFALALTLFITSAVASNAIDQCQGVDTSAHICSKLQAAISITFITSFATMGTCVVLFLGSIKPPEMTFKSYIKSNFRTGGAQVLVDQDGDFENVPLSQVRASPMRVSNFTGAGSRFQQESEEEGLKRSSFDDDNEQEERRMDAFEII